MSTTMHIALGAAIALLGLMLFVSLSSVPAGILLRVWLVCSPLVLMARLNETRRGVHSGYGGLPLSVVGRLALQALVTGFFLASALVLGAFGTLSVLR